MAKEAKVETLAAALAVCERERDTWAERAAAIEAGLEPAAVATEPMPEAVEPEAEASEPDGGKPKGSAWRSGWATAKPESEGEPEAVEPELVTAVA